MAELPQLSDSPLAPDFPLASDPPAASSVSALPAAIETLAQTLDGVAGAPAWSLNDTELVTALGSIATVQSRLDELSSRIIEAAEAMDLARQAGKTSTTAWAAEVSGVSRRDAARTVSLTRLFSEPRTSATRHAWAQGQISTSAARVIVECLADLDTDLGPEAVEQAEATLVEQAGTMQLDDLKVLANRVIEVIDPDGADAILAAQLEAEEQRAQEATTLKITRVGDGTTRLTGRLPDAQAAMLRTTLEAMAAPRRVGHNDGPDGDPTARIRPFGMRMGHALCELIEHLPEDELPQAGGMAATITVALDHQRLIDDLGTVTTSAGVDISPAQARRLACGAGIIPAVLGSQSVVLDQGRRQRLYTTAQRNAVALRDGGCCWDICDRPAAWCETHHLVPWSEGGSTSIDNGAMFCSVHHHLLHTGEWQARRATDGIIEIIPPTRIDPDQKPRRHIRHLRRERRMAAG